MLWLCIALPQLPLEALRSDATAEALVVTAREGSARWIICCNAGAEAAHLQVAMNYNVALALHPRLIALERSIEAERTALERLAAWAYQFSSTVVPGEISEEFRQARSSVLWLEIGASLKLFGGLRNLITHLEKGLGELSYTYRLGIAATLEGAALLARAGIRVAMTTPHALYGRIRTLPISVLTLSADVTRQLHTTGVRTIGLLLELPRDAVAKRFGPGLSSFLDRLIGAAPDPRPVFQLPDKYRARFEFECEVRSTEALLFALRRLLHELAGYLRGRDTAVQQFTIALEHRDRPPTDLRIGLSIADRSADRFFALVRERLEALELPEPATGLTVSADEFAAPGTLQSDLFDSSLRQSEALVHTIDRIAARLGAQTVHAIREAADHRPEASWAPATLDESRPTVQFPERPLWLLPQPKPLQLSTMPHVTAGPERIEAGWWDTGDLRRDYYVVRTRSGADLWIYRDLNDRNWYLHGFWS